MTTRAEFEVFFAGEWQKMIESVEVPDMPGASWDRKAAYLYMEAVGGRYPLKFEREEPAEPEDEFGGY
jgi:hypothetical protein